MTNQLKFYSISLQIQLICHPKKIFLVQVSIKICYFREQNSNKLCRICSQSTPIIFFNSKPLIKVCKAKAMRNTCVQKKISMESRRDWTLIGFHHSKTCLVIHHNLNFPPDRVWFLTWFSKLSTLCFQ